MDTHAHDVTQRARQVSEYVAFWRAHAGMTVVDAAKRADISRSLWTDVERGKQVPKPDTLGVIARALGRDPSELLELVGMRPPAPTSSGADEPDDESDMAMLLAEQVRRLGDALGRLEDRVGVRDEQLDELAARADAHDAALEQLGAQLDELERRADRPGRPPASPKRPPRRSAQRSKGQQ